MRFLKSLLLVSVYSTFSHIPAVTVNKAYSKPVYMHYMPWFDSPEFDGSWGWHWRMNNKNPDKIIDINSGRREIASHYYPLIGAYDSEDSLVIEYHMLLIWFFLGPQASFQKISNSNRPVCIG